MNYEEAVKAWAARKLDIDVATIERVSIDTDSGWEGTDVTGGGWPTCRVNAYLVGERYPKEIVNLFADEDGKEGMYSGRKWNFVDLLQELLGDE